MRKWFIFIGILAILLIGTGIWLAGQAEKGKPEPSEIRLEVEDVL